jgi:hypothetical protein
MAAPPPASKTFTPIAPPPDAYQVQETTAAPEPPPPPITNAREAYAVATGPTTGASTSTGKAPLLDLLRSPNGLRQAVILREIFGPPRSLQPLDSPGQI